MALIKLAVFLVVATMALIGGVAALDVNVVTDFKAVGDGVTDDTNAFIQAWAKVCNGSPDPSNTLIVPSPQKFLVKPHTFMGPCKSKNIIVQVSGSILAPKQKDWGSSTTSTNDKQEFPDWLSFSKVQNLIFKGSATGSINGRATFEDWWQPKPVKGEKKPKPRYPSRPTALAFHGCGNLQVVDLKSQNPPMNHLSINNCQGVTVSNINFVAPEDSPNTDGIDISASSNVNIHDSFTGSGDDCIAMNTGSSNINITNLNCGPGHGISVGSLGKNGSITATAENIHVKNCTFRGTDNGARIKTWVGGKGYARNITFEDITLVATKNPIIIDQHYCDPNQGPCPPKTPTANPSAVAISGVTFKGFHGTASGNDAINLVCSPSVHCKDIVLDSINITAATPGKKVGSSCTNVDDLHLSGTIIPAINCKPAGFIEMVTNKEDESPAGIIEMVTDASEDEDRSEL